jgi:hypothetical protein
METKSILKTLLPYIFIGILIVIASFFFKDCRHRPDLVIVPNDAINRIIKDKQVTVNYYLNKAKIDSLKIDSLSHLKPKYIKGRDRVKDSLIYVSDSICVKNLTILYNECQKIDSVNNAIITNQESHIMDDSHVIGNLTDIVALQKYKLTNDSLAIIDISKEVKRKYRKGLMQGGLVGIGIGFIGTLLLIK